MGVGYVAIDPRHKSSECTGPVTGEVVKLAKVGLAVCLAVSSAGEGGTKLVRATECCDWWYADEAGNWAAAGPWSAVGVNACVCGGKENAKGGTGGGVKAMDGPGWGVAAPGG